jgi:hypothetical protein
MAAAPAAPNVSGAGRQGIAAPASTRASAIDVGVS